jgi:type II secretory pathway component PulF
MNERWFPTFARWWHGPPHKRSNPPAWFPTFARWLAPNWRITPWWPAETRAAQQQSLTRLLAVGIQERLELAPLVAAFAADHRGAYHRLLRRLANLLAHGIALPEALEQTPGVLPDRTILAVRIGAQSGTLAASLKNQLDYWTPNMAETAGKVRTSLQYLWVVGVVMVLLISFLMVKIVPSFIAIFDDFDIQTSATLNALITYTSWLSTYAPLILLAVVLMAVVWRWRRLNRRVRQTWLGRLIGPVAQIRSADLLGQLGVAAAAGRPLVGTVSSLARYHYDPALRRKLLFVRNEVEQGASLYDSMVAANLISNVERRALDQAEALGNRAWTLHQLARARRSRMLRLLETRLQWLKPLIVLALGAIVLFVAVAVLGSLRDLTLMLA